MKRSVVLSLLSVCAAGILASGCVNTPRPTTAYRGKPRTIALSVTVDGALQPTPAQFAAIQAQSVRQFAAMGYVIVTDLSLAEAILRVNFTPNPNDPDNSGRATILGFRNNPYYASAPSTLGRPYPSSYGFAGGFSHQGWGPHNQYGYGYYGYGSSYYDGYSYSSYTLNPVTPPRNKPTHPPHRHDPAYCPPDTNRVQPAFGRFVGNYDAVTPASHPQSYRRRDDSGPSGSSSFASLWGGSRSSSSSSGDYSANSYSRSESSYSRSDPAPAQSAPSYASSYSAPAPSYSSSDSSFSSSSASSSSSSSGSSGSSGTHESSNLHPH